MAGPLMHQVKVDAPANRVFTAITTSQGLSAFWVPGSKAEPVEGSVATFDFGPGVRLEMRIESIDPDKQVKWMCLGNFPGWKDTTVRWDLSPAENGTTSVMFKHEGWAEEMPDEDLASVNYTWGGIVGRLKGYAETGEVKPFLG